MFWSSIKPPSINPFWRHDTSIRWLLVIYLSALRELAPRARARARTNQDKLLIVSKFYFSQIERGGRAGYLALTGHIINVSSVAFSVSLLHTWFMGLFFCVMWCLLLFWVSSLGIRGKRQREHQETHKFSKIYWSYGCYFWMKSKSLYMRKYST